MLPGLDPAICLLIAVTCSSGPAVNKNPCHQAMECSQSVNQPQEIVFGRTIRAVDAPTHHLHRTRHTV